MRDREYEATMKRWSETLADLRLQFERLSRGPVSPEHYLQADWEAIERIAEIASDLLHRRTEQKP